MESKLLVFMHHISAANSQKPSGLLPHSFLYIYTKKLELHCNITSYFFFHLTLFKSCFRIFLQCCLILSWFSIIILLMLAIWTVWFCHSDLKFSFYSLYFESVNIFANFQHFPWLVLEKFNEIVEHKHGTDLLETQCFSSLHNCTVLLPVSLQI